MKITIKKSAVLAITAALSINLMGCGSRDSGVVGDSSANRQGSAAKVEVSEDNGVTVEATEKITKLKKGLSAVRFKGDDGFAAFLAAGGAKTDGEVVQFLAGRLFAENEGAFTINTQAFGCSTFSVQNETT